MLPEEQTWTPSFSPPSPLPFFLLFVSDIGTVHLVNVRYGPGPGDAKVTETASGLKGLVTS